MTLVDLMNILGIVDESLAKIEKHLTEGFPDRALMRTQTVRKQIRKVQEHENNIQGMICKRKFPPHKAAV